MHQTLGYGLRVISIEKKTAELFFVNGDECGNAFLSETAGSSCKNEWIRIKVNPYWEIFVSTNLNKRGWYILIQPHTLVPSSYSFFFCSINIEGGEGYGFSLDAEFKDQVIDLLRINNIKFAVS